MPQINSDELAELLRTQLADLDADAAQQVQAHLASIGENGDVWVASGMDRVHAEGLSDFPFCAQDLRGWTLVNHYRVYFSAAYAGLKKAVAQAIQEFTRLHCGGSPAAFERTIRIAVERRQFWSRFAEIPEIDTAEINRAWSVAHTMVLAVLRAKQDRPLDPSSLSSEAVAAVIEIEGYESAEELLEAVFSDAGSPAMCMNEACYFTCAMEPDQDAGYGEECGTNKMKAAPVLAGIFQGPQEPIPAPIESDCGLTYRAARTVGTAA